MKSFRQHLAVVLAGLILMAPTSINAEPSIDDSISVDETTLISKKFKKHSGHQKKHHQKSKKVHHRKAVKLNHTKKSKFFYRDFWRRNQFSGNFRRHHRF